MSPPEGDGPDDQALIDSQFDAWIAEFRKQRDSRPSGDTAPPASPEKGDSTHVEASATIPRDTADLTPRPPPPVTERPAEARPTPVLAAPAPADLDLIDDRPVRAVEPAPVERRPIQPRRADLAREAEMPRHQAPSHPVMEPAAPKRLGGPKRSARILRTLLRRNLNVRYAQSVLGYLWTILDPTLMAAIYFVVFIVIFQRGDIGERPYFLFLVNGVLAWQWFRSSLNASTSALLDNRSLIGSIRLPREIWVLQSVLAKLVEYLLSLPVLVIVAAIYVANGQAQLNGRLILFPAGVLLLAMLNLGLGFILASVTVLVRDLSKVTTIVLRMGFYLTPVIYSLANVPDVVRPLVALNPMSGILSLMRAGFSPEPIDLPAVILALAFTPQLLLLGLLIFWRLEPAVLKEL